ncbi:unnamed protein product [Periconia digitata]|uniref:Uncharacterized protein n=1 Tax=Periconia digitata TaxID=1303443 RepID=A0A9W4XSK1_9PLEO|nr:unnamed protein product [Periconia digitata]
MTTTNAPYYHMHGRQFPHPANASFMSDHADPAGFDPATPAATSLTPNDVSSSSSTAAVAAPSSSYTYSERRRSEEPELPTASLEDNHHFVELLEAATTAAAGQTTNVGTTSMERAGSLDPSTGKRKRVSSSPPADGGATSAEQPKRARTDIPSQSQPRDTEDGARDISEANSVSASTDTALLDARAAGVHSAAALFRRTSERSGRKYTRPPMSKLFISLQLSPENFLHLQAQAKAFMLDPTHPERQNCVGNRGKGDTDMVKLRLFNCVKDFLSDRVGEQYFGDGVEKPHKSDTLDAARALGEDRLPTDERLIWPRDGNKIISLVTPLLRRMVTNERQRMYAIETRSKGGSKKKDLTPSPTQEDFHTTNDAGQAAKLIQPQPMSSRNVSPSQVPSPPQGPSSQVNTPMPTSMAFTSPLSDRGSATSMHYIESDSTAKFFPNDRMKLPTTVHDDSELLLNRINLFVSKNAHVLRTEKRFVNAPSAPLIHMTWQELSIRIVELVKETLLRYPDLQEELKRSANMGPEALRGLAAAATEMHHNNHTNASSEMDADDDSGTVGATSSSHAPQSTSDAASLISGGLPGYRVGAQTSQGWTNIANEDDWVLVKRDMARAVWADKVCNVVVSLLP